MIALLHVFGTIELACRTELSQKTTNFTMQSLNIVGTDLKCHVVRIDMSRSFITLIACSTSGTCSPAAVQFR